jgi:polyisoprenoid-binding protein YceI
MKKPSLIALITVALSAAAFAQTTKFDSKPGSSKIKMDGTSNIHDWIVEGTLVGGSMELDSAFVADPTKAKPGKIAGKVDTMIPVRSLHSNKSKAMDDRMYEAMKLAQFGRIYYHLTELTLKETPTSAEGPFTFDSAGELAVAGVTNKVSFPVTMTKSDKTIKASGTTSVKMTSFKIDPPNLNLPAMAIRTGDDVKITFDWVTAAAEAK